MVRIVAPAITSPIEVTRRGVIPLAPVCGNVPPGGVLADCVGLFVGFPAAVEVSGVGEFDCTAPNVTGMRTSCVRSLVRVWSARVTTEQRTLVQSLPMVSFATSRSVNVNVPSGPYGFASPSPYGGGFEEIQT